MKPKDFSRLPLGEYDLGDGIYKYTMKKSPCDDGTHIYQIRVDRREHGGMYHLMSESISLFEAVEYYHEDLKDRRKYGDFMYKTMSSISGVGGIRIHSADVKYRLVDLYVLPRGSFKQYVQNEIEQTELLTA